MIATVIQCDACGAARGEANHWLLGHTISGPAADNWGYAIGRWNEAIVKSTDHFCGMECALKQLNAFLEKQKAGAK